MPRNMKPSDAEQRIQRAHDLANASRWFCTNCLREIPAPSTDSLRDLGSLMASPSLGKGKCGTCETNMAIPMTLEALAVYLHDTAKPILKHYEVMKSEYKSLKQQLHSTEQNLYVKTDQVEKLLERIQELLREREEAQALTVKEVLELSPAAPTLAADASALTVQSLNARVRQLEDALRAAGRAVPEPELRQGRHTVV